ncbi:MAG: DUF2313 domain-containing protein [Geobacteraceae bacterium]|nr:DUF2313 domain-containing protein [Geobacteraceae bacterium]
MSHKDALKLLTPLALGNAFDRDIAIEGAYLDQAGYRDSKLLAELLANSTYELLEAWEKTYASAPFYGDSLQVRQNRVVQKMSELGRLDRAYFIQLAAALGYAIVMDELHPFMPGWNGAGDELGDDNSDWCWRVYYAEVDAYAFRASASTAGEYLSYSFSDIMRQIFNDLKPADTFVEFIES